MQQLIGRYGIYSSQRFRNLIENEEIHVKISDGSQATSCGRCDDVTCADFVMSSKSAIRNFVDKNESEFASSSDGIFSNISSEENKEWLRRGLRWTEIARIMNRGYRECIDRWRAIQRSKLNVGTFTQEEDELILKKVSEWDGHIRNVWLSLEKDLNRTPQLIKLRYNEINSEIKAMKTFSGVEDACIIQKVQEMGKADEAIWINLERVLSRPANLIRRRWLHHLSKSIVLYEKQEAVSSMDYNSESPQGSVSDNDQLSTNYSSSVSSTRTKQNNSSTRKRSSGQY